MQDQRENHHKRNTHPIDEPHPHITKKPKIEEKPIPSKNGTGKESQYRSEQKNHHHNNENNQNHQPKVSDRKTSQASSERQPTTWEKFEQMRSKRKVEGKKESSQKPHLLNITPISDYESFLRVQRTVNPLHNFQHNTPTFGFNSYSSFTQQLQVKVNNFPTPTTAQQNLPMNRPKFEKISIQDLQNKLFEVNQWQDKYFYEETKDTSNDRLKYSSRIQNQYKMYQELALTQINTIRFRTDVDNYFSKGNYYYSGNLVYVEGLGYMPDPFLVNSNRHILPNLIDVFYKKLREAINNQNSNPQYEKIDIPVQIKDKDEKSKNETIAEMNIAFKVLDCVKDNITHRILVVSPSGYGTKKQSLAWYLIFNVLNDMNQELQSDKDFPLTIVMQTGYNNDRWNKERGKNLPTDMVYEPIFSKTPTTYSSLFDELIQSLRDAIKKQYNGYINEPIDAKACSEKKIMQFETKLKAIYDEVKPVEMENTVLGKSYHGITYHSRQPCTECMKAAPAYYMMNQIKSKQLPETKVNSTSPQQNSSNLEYEIKNANNEIERIKNLLSSLEVHLKFAHEGFNTKKIRNEVTKAEPFKDKEEQARVIMRINESIQSHRKKLDNAKEALGNKQDIVSEKKSEHKKSAQRYSFLLSPYRDDQLRFMESREPETVKQKKEQESYYNSNKKP